MSLSCTTVPIATSISPCRSTVTSETVMSAVGNNVCRQR